MLLIFLLFLATFPIKNGHCNSFIHRFRHDFWIFAFYIIVQTPSHSSSIYDLQLNAIDASGNVVFLPPVKSDELTHFTFVSSDLCLQFNLVADVCYEIAQKIYNHLNQNVTIREQIKSDEIETSKWWESYSINGLKTISSLDLESLIQQGHPIEYDRVKFTQPGSLAAAVKTLANIAGNYEGALQLASEIIENANPAQISPFLLLEWASLGCQADRSACLRSAYVVGALLASRNLCPLLEFYAHLHLSGIWEDLHQSDYEDFHFRKAVHVAVSYNFSFPEKEVYFSIDDPDLWVHASGIPSSVEWHCLRCSHKAVERFWHDSYNLQVVGITHAFKELENYYYISTRMPVMVPKLVLESTGASGIHNRVTILGSPILQYNGLPYFDMLNATLIQTKTVLSRQVQLEFDSRCMTSMSMCKFDEYCRKTISNLQSSQCHKPLLITGCGYSGTKFTSFLLDTWNFTFDSSFQHSSKNSATREQLGIGRSLAAVHENFYFEHDVLVSWHARCNAWHFSGLALPSGNMKNSFSQGTGSYFLNPVPCLYDTVLHQVRHPLSFLTSALATFSNFNTKEVERLVDLILAKTWPPLHFNRTALFSQVASEYESTFSNQRRVYLDFLMLHWVTWNAQIEAVADHTYQVEEADWIDLICVRAGFKKWVSSGCQKEKVPSTEYIRRGPGGNSHNSYLRKQVTWEELETVNAYLARQVWLTALRYGYQRHPPP